MEDPEKLLEKSLGKIKQETGIVSYPRLKAGAS